MLPTRISKWRFVIAYKSTCYCYPIARHNCVAMRVCIMSRDQLANKLVHAVHHRTTIFQAFVKTIQ